MRILYLLTKRRWVRSRERYGPSDYFDRCRVLKRASLSVSTWSHRDMPTNRGRLAAIFDTLISGVSIHIRFPAVQRRFGRVDVVNVGRCTDDGVDHPRLSTPMSGSGGALLRHRPLL